MAMSERPATPNAGWKARQLLSVDDFSLAEIEFVLRLTDYYAAFLKRGARPQQRLAGKTQINLFYEDSTRTNLSFELAGKKLGADVLNVPVAASSVNKGESLIDTAQTLAAMGAHVMIVRQKDPHVLAGIAARVACPVINAGDGAHEHPTQALLDAATIRSALGGVEGRVIVICGDVKHSRVAASGAALFKRLGAEVRFVGPAALMPDHQFPEIARFASLRQGLSGADIVMALRFQFERMGAEGRDAARGYFEEFGITYDALKFANPGAFIMHPGPMNRGVEIDGALADDTERSLITRQVFTGVALRMACLDALIT